MDAEKPKLADLGAEAGSLLDGHIAEVFRRLARVEKHLGIRGVPRRSRRSAKKLKKTLAKEGQPQA